MSTPRAAREAPIAFALASGALEAAYRLELALEDLYISLTNMRTPAHRNEPPDMDGLPEELNAEAAARLTRCVRLVELTKELLASKTIV